MNGEEGDGETQSSSRPSARLTGSGGSLPSLVVVAMATGGYDRVELDYELSITEVAKAILNSDAENLLSEWTEVAKETDGRPDQEGKHYSHHIWIGKVMVPHTRYNCGSHENVTMGITDYENFDKTKKCGRREGRRHFFAKGKPDAVNLLIDIFKTAIPGTLWRHFKIDKEVRKKWPVLKPNTFVPKVTLADAQLQVALGTTGARASSSGAGASSSGPDRNVTGSGASTASRPQPPPVSRPASPAPAPAPAAAPTPGGSVGEEGGGDLPKSLAGAHHEDQTQLASVLTQCTRRNIGVEAGTDSGLLDLPAVIADSVANDNVAPPMQHSDPAYYVSLDEDEEHQEVQEEPQGGGQTGSEADGNPDDLPEQNFQKLRFLLRPRYYSKEPRLDVNEVKLLMWSLQKRICGKGIWGSNLFLLIGFPHFRSAFVSWNRG